MLRIGTAITCLMFLALPAWAAPIIAVDERSYTFEDRSSDRPIEHTFVLSNVGDEMLEITNVRTSCGCTAAELKTNTLEPGEHVELNVRARFSPRPGIQRKTITVTSNDPATRQLVMSIEGRVSDPIMFEPHRLYLGSVQPGTKVERTVQVLVDTPHDLNIMNHEIVLPNNMPLPPDDPYWQSDLQLSNTHSGHELHISAIAPDKLGRHQVTVRLYTNHPEKPVLNFPVSINVSSVLSIAPDSVVVVQDISKQTPPQTRYVSIRRTDRNDQTPFEITKITPPDESVEVAIQSVGKAAYRIRLTNLDPMLITSESQLTIETDIEEMRTIEIPLTVCSR